MKRSSLISLIIISSSFKLIFAQTENKQHIAFDGQPQVAVTTNGHGLFLNFGGPGIKLKFTKFAIAINMLPSLRFEKESPKPIVIPYLGVGLQLYFLKDRRFVLSFPCYYYAAKNIWTVSAGIGYVLSKPK